MTNLIYDAWTRFRIAFPRLGLGELTLLCCGCGMVLWWAFTLVAVAAFVAGVGR